MIADVQKVELLRWKFTELGKSLRELSDRNEAYFDLTLETLRSGFGDVVSVLSSDISSDVSQQLDAHSLAAAQISKSYEDFVRRSSASLGEFNESIKTSSKTFNTVSQRVTDMLNQADLTKEHKKDKKSKTVFNKVSAWSRKQGITGKFNAALNKTLIPRPGAVVGGTIALMLQGFLQEDKLRKEAGEVYNILVESFDLATRNMVQKGTAIISTLQTKLYRFYGISKEETQAVARQFISGGLGAEIFGSAGVNFANEESGSLGKNFITFSLALDKMFELSGGTSAQRMVSFMEDYGMSLTAAKDATYELMISGRESGIGTMQFVKNVETAASSLKKLGIGIEQVISLSVDLQKGFEDLGVPRNFAGKQAALGIQAITQTMGNLSKDMTIVVAERLGYGKGIEARQKFLDASSRVLRKGDPGEVADFIDEIVRMTEEATQTTDEATVRDTLERMLPGLGFEGAKSAYMISKMKRSGDLSGAKKGSRDSMEQFKNAFMTERKKQSAFDRELTRITTGMKDVGSALLGISANILAVLITGFRSLSAFFSGDKEKQDRAAADMNRAFDGIEKNIEKMKGSFGQVGTGFKNMGADFLGAGGVSSLGGAFGGSFGSVDSAAPAAETPVVSQGNPARQVIRTVPIWVKPKDVQAGREKKFDVLGNVGTEGGEAADQTGWVGGGLALDFVRVNEVGDLQFNIIGNCPRCGLLFSDTDTEEKPVQVSKGYKPIQSSLGRFTALDVEALARVAAHETSHIKGRAGSEFGEFDAIAWAVLNRAKRNKAKSSEGDLYKAVTAAKKGSEAEKEGGFGAYMKDGKATGRFMGSAAAAPAWAKRRAEEILSNQVADPTGGAESWLHDAPSRMNPMKMSHFGKLVNTANIKLQKPAGVKDAKIPQGTYLRLYGPQRSKQAADAAQVQTSLHGADGVKLAQNDASSKAEG